MGDINSELIERYQIILQKDPKSKVFAPLSESYRKLNLQKEALRITRKGVQYHPHFAGGHVAYARVLFDLKQLDLAIQHAQIAVDLSPENLLAQELLAQCHLKKKQPKEAFKAYKMLLFLNPKHEKALKAVKKLESLTADEYDDDLFEMKPLDHQMLQIQIEKSIEVQPGEHDERWLDRVLSLADAYFARNDMERAREALMQGERQIGPHTEITRRLKLIYDRRLDLPDERPESISPLPTRSEEAQKAKREQLNRWLKQIDERRIEV